jgi:hypothetical protein
MTASAVRNPITDLIRKLVACIRLLASDKEFEREGGISGIQRLLKGADTDTTNALADYVERGAEDIERLKQETLARVKQALEAGYVRGVRATEERFRPDGKLTFCEVALCMERQIYRIPPDKHEFINKMAIYARQEYEPTQKQGKFLFDLFVQYLGGKVR